ncbi:Membrane protein OS=Streptomyces antimycoticus OX=68175 GN=SSPO_040090 PE=4 SV=1 [Streptomyces antimycoticus]
MVIVAAILTMCGLNTIAPGEARVVLLRPLPRHRAADGLRWVNPLTSREKISTRVRNHETAILKVNDAYGNPIELAAVVVWRVEDTAQAMFEVDDFLEVVPLGPKARYGTSPSSTRTRHHRRGRALAARQRRGDHREAAVELHARVEAAGVRIIESRFTHLAYAPEIASAMLQRQQAGAVVAARRQIVDGAVGMVEAALARITEEEIVTLDEERKAAMVSNLMVVLCGDHSRSPL